MKMKTIQRAFAWALTLVMVLSAAPLGVFAEGEEEQKCVCTVKCGETVKEDCPVCGGESGNPAACAGKTQEELEAEAKLAAEEAERKAAEEAAQKAAEEEKRKAEEESAKKAAEEEKRKAEEAAQKAAKEGGNPPAKVEPKKSEDTTNKNIAPASDDDETELNNTVETVEVKFVTNGAEENIEPMTVAKGGTITLPQPTKTGFNFDGWYVSETFEGAPVDGSKTYNEATFLYANWTVAAPTTNTSTTVTVTFYANGGTVEPSSMTAEKNGKLKGELPIPNERDGYTFEGWYVNQDCTGVPVNGEETYEADTPLYAKWTKNKSETGVDVIFNFQLENVENVTKKTNAEGKLEGELPSHTKTGFDLKGWYLTTEYKEDQKVTSGTEFKQETTVYAKWEQQPEAVTVTFKAEGGACGVERAKVNENKKLESLPKPEREGYTFLGWYIENTETKVTLETIYENSTTLVARWKKEVSVEKTGNVTLGENFLKENSEKLAEETEKVVVHVVQRDETGLAEVRSFLGGALDGKELLAAYDLSVHMMKGNESQELTSVNGLIQFDFTVTGNVVAVYHNTTSMPLFDGTNPGYRQTGNTLTIWANSFSPYAIVTNGTYEITLDPQGGTFDDGVSNTMTTNTDGKLTEDLPVPTKTGYTFGGWYKVSTCTGEPVKKNDTVFDQNATIYAKWTPIDYTVVFHDNYRNPEQTCTQDFDYGKKKQLSYDTTVIVRDYYQLDGWAETKDGAKVYEPQDYVQNLCSQQRAEKHLYAVWTYAPRQVTFDADGGKIKKGDAQVDAVVVDTQEKPINTVSAKDVPVPELREGYYFGGWYTRKDGKGDLVKTGEAKEPTVFTADATVYAYWIKFEPVTVTFKCQGGTARIGSTDVKEFTMQTKWPGVLDGTPTTPGRSGYKFEGWYTAAGVKVDEGTLFLRDSTVYARWKRAVSITGNPRTGDQVKLEAAIGILIAAAIGLGATVVLKKRKEK